MAKISKQKAKLHLEACEMLEQDVLSRTEIDFVYGNWLPSYNNNTSWSGAFFTPLELLRDFSIYTPESGRCVDLCAGIGGLTRATIDNSSEMDRLDMICVELNYEYYEVGKKLVPEATWIHGSIFDKVIFDRLKGYDKIHAVISNPPFGNMKIDKQDWLNYNGVAELMAVEVGLKLADYGVFILPQGSLPFQYSGQQCYSEKESRVFNKFKTCNPDFGISPSSVDTSFVKDEWLDASPTVEIITVDKIFDNVRV